MNSKEKIGNKTFIHSIRDREMASTLFLCDFISISAVKKIGDYITRIIARLPGTSLNFHRRTGLEAINIQLIDTNQKNIYFLNASPLKCSKIINP